MYLIKYKAALNLKFKCVCIAMCSLVMSLLLKVTNCICIYTNSILTQSIITYNSLDT